MNTTEVKQPIPVEKLIMHVQSHADEGFARWQIRKYGETFFPGARDAALQLVSKSPELTDADYDRMKMALIGCGHGRFDDHSRNGRIKDCSATRLVTKYLEITDKATLVLADEIHWCDNNSGVNNTQLAELVKSADRNLPNGTGLVLKWLDIAFDVLHEQLTMGYAQSVTEHSVKEYFDALVKAGLYKDPKLQDHIRRLLDVSIQIASKQANGRTYFTEIDFIVRSMQRIGKKIEDIYAWLRFAFDRLEGDQILFGKAADEVGNRKNKYKAYVSSLGHDGYLWFSVVHTDNPMALRAANFLRQQVTMIRNGNGQVQIFLDKRTGLTLDALMAMIRWMEASPEIRAKLDWKEIATSSGNHPCAENWYYNRVAGQILNGSITHPGVPATEVASQAFVDMISSAFQPRLIAKWQRDHGVPQANSGHTTSPAIPETAPVT